MLKFGFIKEHDEAVKIEEYYINGKLNHYIETRNYYLEKLISKFSSKREWLSRKFIYFTPCNQKFKEVFQENNFDETFREKIYLIPHIPGFGELKVVYKDYHDECKL